MPSTHTLTPAQLARVTTLWKQRQHIDELLQFFLLYIAEEAGLPPSPNYNLSQDLTIITPANTSPPEDKML